MNIIKTKHNLDFEVAEWELDSEFKRFRVGTCEGLWGCTDKEYFILSIINKEKGNGHFEDVLEWFEYSAKRDNKNLALYEVWNKKLKKHLVEKRGYIKRGQDVYREIKKLNNNKI